MKEFEAKIQNNFSVNNFLKQIDVDFMFSYHEDTNEFFLMNDDMIGVFNHDTIFDLMNTGNRVIIINDKQLSMNAYNIDEAELSQALLNM